MLAGVLPATNTESPTFISLHGYLRVLGPVIAGKTGIPCSILKLPVVVTSSDGVVFFMGCETTPEYKSCQYPTKKYFAVMHRPRLTSARLCALSPALLQ